MFVPQPSLHLWAQLAAARPRTERLSEARKQRRTVSFAWAEGGSGDDRLSGGDPAGPGFQVTQVFTRPASPPPHSTGLLSRR